MIRHRPSLRIRPCLVVLVAGLVVAIVSPVEPGAGQTPPPPAPDPVPDANPNPPPTGDSSGGDSSGSLDDASGGDSSGSLDDSSGGDSSGSSSGSAGASHPPASGGTESSTSSRDGQESETKPEPSRQKHADNPDLQAIAAPEPRDPPTRPSGLALGVGAQANASTPADLEPFVLALASALALVLLILAATPPRVLAGVSVALAAQERKVELGIAAVLLSLIFGLLAAQCGAQLR